MDSVPLEFIENVVQQLAFPELQALCSTKGKFARFAQICTRERFDFFVHFSPIDRKAFVHKSNTGGNGDDGSFLENAEKSRKHLMKLEIDMSRIHRLNQRETPRNEKLFELIQKLSLYSHETQLKLGDRRQAAAEETREFSEICLKLKPLSALIDQLHVAVYNESAGFVDLVSSILNSDRLRSVQLEAESCHEKYRAELQKTFFKPSFETLFIEASSSALNTSLIPAILTDWIRLDARLEKKFICSSGNPKIFDNEALSAGFKRQSGFDWQDYEYPKKVGDLVIPQWAIDQMDEHIHFEYEPTARFYRFEHPSIPNHFACLTLVIDLANRMEEFNDLESQFSATGDDEENLDQFLATKLEEMEAEDFSSRTHFYYLFFC